MAERTNSNMLFANFNQDFSYVARDDGARGIVEMLFCTSLIALVGAADQPQSSPRKLQIVNTKSGDVLLFSTRSLTVANVIQAHKSPISFLSINSTGTLLATSSDKGTVIRVWTIPGAEKLYQFRRGTREAKIYSMNFNSVSTLLAVSSAHDTVHIFKLARGKEGSGSTNGKLSSPSPSSDSVDTVEGGVDGGYEAFIEKKKNGGVSSSLRKRSLQVTKTLSHSMGGYLPNTLTEMWEPSRDFAFLRLPTSGARCVVALSGERRGVFVDEAVQVNDRFSIVRAISPNPPKFSLLDSGDDSSGLAE
ncbi:hypothetical protein HHX47_DHR4000602 [Lentinula edodes]|nr:hypothetical protein HHX47_DHR4000602 [Lentinula edodes]